MQQCGKLLSDGKKTRISTKVLIINPQLKLNAKSLIEAIKVTSDYLLIVLFSHLVLTTNNK